MALKARIQFMHELDQVHLFVVEEPTHQGRRVVYVHNGAPVLVERGCEMPPFCRFTTDEFDAVKETMRGFTDADINHLQDEIEDARKVRDAVLRVAEQATRR